MQMSFLHQLLTLLVSCHHKSDNKEIAVSGCSHMLWVIQLYKTTVGYEDLYPAAQLPLAQAQPSENPPPWDGVRDCW